MIASIIIIIIIIGTIIISMSVITDTICRSSRLLLFCKEAWRTSITMSLFDVSYYGMFPKTECPE